MKKRMIIACLGLSLAIAGCSQNTGEGSDTDTEVTSSMKESSEENAMEESSEKNAEPGIGEETETETETETKTETEAELQEEDESQSEIDLQENIVHTIKNPSWEYYRKETIESDAADVLHLEYYDEEPNEITDVDAWATENDITIPQFPYADADYTYEYGGVAGDSQILVIRENFEGGKIYTFELADFSMPDEYKEEDVEFVQETIQYAKVAEGILYVATGHNTYSSSAPATGYITAIGMESGEVLWKTESRMCNSRNFEIIGDSIVCGYGFTAEDDYLYVLNREDGQWIEELPLASAAEYIVRKGSSILVRCYDMNYVYSMFHRDGREYAQE